MKTWTVGFHMVFEVFHADLSTVHSARTKQPADSIYGDLSGMNSVSKKTGKGVLPMERRKTLGRTVGQGSQDDSYAFTKLKLFSEERRRT